MKRNTGAYNTRIELFCINIIYIILISCCQKVIFISYKTENIVQA